MPQPRTLYRSSNGDAWFLIEEGGRLFVRHEPNRSSAGEPSQIALGLFLLKDTHAPQQEALHQLIMTLLEDDETPGG